ncbi:hypothetical protein DSM106972_031040 [Dulcicalothrix desertica PCC 7102]|uniref:Uncharacterized protein n=1 Tax=Dulcicalothrix desertica PCC 7102 TaxID=232991 RepID=A0A433VIG8_9CYAN|nr:hypothetical protein [Dulcicalothrix desertica]RUT05898.1 hypothetical protein DSM106972_031040 [Dulcicalothrix desertica PCC 7102]TWH54405.1 hypothetical protein CAL7102_02436 [Dulcicalothrix desertica PCC 7102]
MMQGMELELANLVISTFTNMKSQNETVLKNQEKILEKLDEVQDSLQSLGQKIDEQVLRNARAGMRHLIDGINSGVTKIRDSEFQLARQKFSVLIELNPNENTHGTSGEIDNKILIAFGYYGSFHYFNLQGDKRSAAIQVYECVEKWSEWGSPLFALQMFSPKFFSKNYAQIIETLVKQISEIQVSSGNVTEEVGTLGSVAGTATGVGVMMGLGAASGIGAGAGGIGLLLAGPVGWGILGVGVLSAGIVGNMFPKKQKQVEISASDKAKYEQLLKELQAINTELYEECKRRKRMFQNTTLDGLLSIGMKAYVMPFTLEVENVIRRSDLRISNSDKVTLKREVGQLNSAVNQKSASQAEVALFNIGNLLRGLSGVVQEFANLLDKWNGLTEQLNKSGLLR